jgi:hypothetical protein
VGEVSLLNRSYDMGIEIKPTIEALEKTLKEINSKQDKP